MGACILFKLSKQASITLMLFQRNRLEKINELYLKEDNVLFKNGSGID